MNAVLRPQAKPQPDADSYGPDALELYPRLTRAVFKEVYGFQAPPYNPKELVRRFFDSSAPGQADEPYVYGRWEVRDGKPYYRRVSITAGQARVPNLPGAYDYPKYAIAPTEAVWKLSDGGTVPINVEYLALWADAIALRNELFGMGPNVAVGDIVEQPQSNPAAALVYPADEARRVLTITINGEPANVGKLLKMRNAMGVGAPGAWRMSGGQILWDSQIPQDTGELNAEMPIPQRELLPNERAEVGFGGNLIFRRTDRQAAVVVDDEKAQAGRVREILERITVIQNRLFPVLFLLVVWAATAAAQPAVLRQGGLANACTTAGTSTAYTCDLTPALSAYADRLTITVKFDEASGASPTLDVNSLGVRKLYRKNGSSAPTQIGAGEIRATTYVLAYDSALDSGTGGFLLDVGGVTRYYVIPISGGNFNPGDAQTNYAGCGISYTWGGTEQLRQCPIPITGTVVAVHLFFVHGSTGSSETSSVYFRLNGSDVATISSAVQNDQSAELFYSTSLSVSVAAVTDVFSIKWVTPTWATNPTSVITNGFVVVSY